VSRSVLVLRALGGLAVGLCVAVGGAWLLGVDSRAVLDALAHAPWLAVAGCAVSALVMLALQSLRWWSVMRPVLGVRYVDACRAFAVAATFNALVPGRGGDLVKVEAMARRTGKSRATVVGAEVVDRWLDAAGWVPAFAIACALGDPPPWLVTALGTFAAGLTLWAVVMVVLGRVGFRFSDTSRMGRVWSALTAGMQTFRSRRILLIALLLAPLPWLWETVVIAFAGRAFGLDLTLVMAFSLLMAFNLATVVPSPGGVGTTEAGGTAALAFFGFDRSKALAFMLVYHLAQLVPGVLAGAIVLATQGGAFFRRLASEPEAH